MWNDRYDENENDVFLDSGSGISIIYMAKDKGEGGKEEEGKEGKREKEVRNGGR